MNSKKGLLILMAPVIAVLLLGAAAIARRETPLAAIPRQAPAAAVPEPVVVPEPAPPPAPRRRPAAAPPRTVQISDEARLRTVYQSYRTALATGDKLLSDTLYDTLVRERPAAIWLAQEDLESAE